MYTADLSPIQSRKCIYADDIALAYQGEDFQETENVISSDLAIFGEYFKTWKLQPNPVKTEVSAFHLNNRRANYKLNISFDGAQLTQNEFPEYLGVTLDRSLTYKSHIKKTAAKMSARANIVQKPEHLGEPTQKCCVPHRCPSFTPRQNIALPCG